MRKAQTTTIGGGAEYAKVSERLKLFREDCPNGSIKIAHEFVDGAVVLNAYVLKDKANPDSSDATGSAYGELKGNKAYEKLESIALGRALAILGYLASGEIASSDEMEEFYQYKEEKVEEAIGNMKQAETLEELKTIFMSLGSLMANAKVIEAKDKKKGELSEKN